MNLQLPSHLDSNAALTLKRLFCLWPGFDAEIILSKLKEWGVSMLFVIGGDGTHRGAQKVRPHSSKRPQTVTEPKLFLDHITKHSVKSTRCGKNGHIPKHSTKT